jgi:hypothetical protein
LAAVVKFDTHGQYRHQRSGEQQLPGGANHVYCSLQGLLPPRHAVALLWRDRFRPHLGKSRHRLVPRDGSGSPLRRSLSEQGQI